MDALPLPPRPNLEQYRKRAKDLVRACGSGADDAVRAWATEWLTALAKAHEVTHSPFVQGSIDRAIARIGEHARAHWSGAEAGGARCTLADAQLLVARAHGFESWPRFVAHIDGIARKDSGVHGFEAAADAVVTGAVPRLEALLKTTPELIHARSTRAHRATLLHYVSANGVEDFRQRTPANAERVARTLLEAGAEVDALAETYGGGSLQTPMNLLVSSVHPAQAGVQVTLVETLLDSGAAINGLDDNGSPLMTALIFGYSKAAEALARRGARVDNVIAAAALGRAELVRELIAAGGSVAPAGRRADIAWLRLPTEPGTVLAWALVWACRFGRAPVVELLLEAGVDPASADADGQTGLHWASAHGHMDVIDLLLANGAPLEATNSFEGTVLDQVLWFVRNDPIDGVDYRAVLRKLLDAGARTDVYPSMRACVEEALKRPSGGDPGVLLAKP